MRKLLKLFGIGPRLAWAFVAGVVVRTARRIAGKPPRIWHGFSPMFSIPGLVAADRRAGFPSRSVVRHVRLRDYQLVREVDFDTVYEGDGTSSDAAHWLCLADLLRHGDIWWAHFEDHFFRWDQRRMNARVMRVIRAAGIRILVAPH
ncbi:MAG TPA: hypothetical protein VN181_16015, partial [Thermoanaerobaculia bacterium]|nr:hypothetical protein [Thermoanaerobaculia bacterium]